MTACHVRSLLRLLIAFVVLNEGGGFMAFSSTIFKVPTPHQSTIITSSRRRITQLCLNRANKAYEQLEARDKKEVIWLQKITEKLVGAEGNSSDKSVFAVGSLTPYQIASAQDAIRTWAARTSIPSNSRRAPHLAEKILKRLIQEQREGNNPNVQIDTRMYNIVIDAWGKSTAEMAAQRAEDMLIDMERAYSEHGDRRLKPDSKSFNNVIKAWIKSKNRFYAVTKAEALVERMRQMSEEDEEIEPPSRRSYNLLLYAYYYSNLPDAAERAHRLLERMEDDFQNGDEEAAPNINSYTLVIRTYAKTKKNGLEEKAQGIFDQLLDCSNRSHLQPNIETFNAIMAVWATSTDQHQSLDRILKILKQREDHFERGNILAKPDGLTVSTVMTAFINSNLLDEATQFQQRMLDQYGVKPDVISTNTLMNSWAKSKRSNALEVVMTMLDKMERDTRAGDEESMPDNFSFVTAMDASLRHDKEGAELRCIQLLRRMKRLHEEHGGEAPSVEVYNVYLNAIASKPTSRAAARALDLLWQMESDEHKDVPEPDTISYDTVLKALSRTGDIESAELLLDRMEELSSVSPTNALSPTTRSYLGVLSALARSTNPDKAERALLMVQRMARAYDEDGNVQTKPNLHCINAALNACAFTRGSPEVRNKAFVAMSNILHLAEDYHCRLDHLSYATILRACSNLLDAGDRQRDFWVDDTFERAVKRGQVSDRVLKQLQFAASEELFDRLIEEELRPQGIYAMDDKVDNLYASLPHDWTRNVCDTRRRNTHVRTRQQP